MVQVRLTQYPQALFVPQLVCQRPIAQGDDLWVPDAMIYPLANACQSCWRLCRRIGRGGRMAQLAREHGVSRQTIYQIAAAGRDVLTKGLAVG